MHPPTTRRPPRHKRVKMPLRDFQILHKLGEGSFGTVYKVRRHEDTKLYAMKRVQLGQMSDAEVADALNEVRVLASVNHPHVCGFLEAFCNESELVVIIDFCADGDLGQRIERAKASRRLIEETSIKSWLGQIAKGLACLHAHGIIHRDLKPANCFVAEEDRVRLGDFNVSKVLKQGKVLMQTKIGTPYYMAPEVWSDCPYTWSADIWAFGCTAYELCALRPPFVARSLPGLGRIVKQGTYDALARTYTKPLRDVVTEALHLNPRKRPTASNIAARPLFTNDVAQESSMATDVSLIRTIAVPKDRKLIGAGLPGARYAEPRSPVAWGDAKPQFPGADPRKKALLGFGRKIEESKAAAAAKASSPTWAERRKALALKSAALDARRAAIVRRAAPRDSHLRDSSLERREKRCRSRRGRAKPVAAVAFAARPAEPRGRAAFPARLAAAPSARPSAAPPAPTESPPIKPRGYAAKVIRGALRDVNDDGAAAPPKAVRPQRPAGGAAARALAARAAAVRAFGARRATGQAAVARPPVGVRRRPARPLYAPPGAAAKIQSVMRGSKTRRQLAALRPKPRCFWMDPFAAPPARRRPAPF